MATINRGRLSLGLVLDGGSGLQSQSLPPPNQGFHQQPPPLTTDSTATTTTTSSSSSSTSTLPPSQPFSSSYSMNGEPPEGRRQSAPNPSPIATTTTHHHLSGDALQDADPSSSPLSVSPTAIPPPPSPRRHKSIVQRSRAVSSESSAAAGPSGSSAFPSSKSSVELRALGLAMTSSSLPVAPTDRRGSLDTASRYAFGDSRIADEPLEWEGDASALDNSARFYHRLHASSRTASPTRSNASVSPSSRRSVSPGNAGSSPIYPRRNLTLPISATSSTPGASLSATLSPNSRFLQQHLPPLFPVSPEADIDNPFGHPMVILTPTTKDWRELKAIGRLEGTTITSDSDSVSSSSRSRSPTPPPAQLVTAVSPDGGKKEFPPSPVEEIDPHTPIRAGFQQNAPQDGDVVLQDLDQNLGSLLSLNDSPARHMHRFNSIGRRDSLRMNERPPIDFDAPRPKTKRELERERLFRMVDQEIAEDGSSGAGPTSGRSWGVVEIGSGLKTSPPAHNELAHPEAGSSLAPMLTPVEEVSSEPPSKSASPALSALSDKPASPAPQLQVQTVSPPGPSTKVLNDDSSNETSPIERTQAAPLHDAPRETESERFEAIRNYSRSVSTRRALGSRSTSRAPSRAPSRGPSRRGSMTDEPPSPPRSPRRRDTNRVSLVAGRVVQPLSFPGLMPLTSLNKDAGLKASLQNFSPFRPKDALVAGALSVPSVADRGNVSHAPSTTVPSECATPSSECAGGAGGHGIDDYVLLREAGKGAYGLVLRAKAKGANGEPVGDEVIIKYIIKSRILADCWKKHKALGPIPVEIHVMDQLRHLIYHRPVKKHPWDPFRSRPGVDGGEVQSSETSSSATPTDPSRTGTPLSDSVSSPTQRFLEVEIKHSPERGHPNICKLLDFFEDREFYYLVMPRFGTGVDLFDRVESQAAGLEPFEVRSLLGQLTDAVRFLHANGIVHRDIKDENVILDGDGRCQLIDFGSAAHWRPGKRWDTFSGTLHYASPEIMRGEMYTGKEQDIWALGTVAYVLLVGETPFAELPDDVLAGIEPGSRALEALDARCDGDAADEGREPDGGGALGDAADFVHRCLEQDLANRPTADNLLTHKFLIGYGGWTGRRGWIKPKPKPGLSA